MGQGRGKRGRWFFPLVWERWVVVASSGNVTLPLEQP